MRCLGLLISVAVWLVGCAHQQPVTYWEKNKKTNKIVVHHVTRSYGRVRDRTEELTAKLVTPSEIHVYDLGRMPDGNGGMSEAHRYTESSSRSILICGCLKLVSRGGTIAGRTRASCDLPKKNPLPNEVKKGKVLCDRNR